MLEGCRIAVVVPAFNEARLIGQTLQTIPVLVDQIIVVDDASEDATSTVVEACDDPRVQLIRHDKNRGVGAAIVTGYGAAFGSGAAVAVVMAGDGQMDPDDLEDIARPVARGEADYVKGDRLSHPNARTAMPLFRFFGNHLLSRATRLSTGLRLSDSQCGYTALGAGAAAELDLDRIWSSYGYPNDLLSRLAVAELRVLDVVVRPIYAEEESGIRPGHLVTAFPWVLARAAGRRLRALSF